MSDSEPPAGSGFPARAYLVSLTLVGGAIALAFVSPWLLSAALIVGCGLFVSFEFALVKVPLRTLERDVQSGRRGAGALVTMKNEMNAMLAACQFGITATSLGLTLAMEPAIHHALEANNIPSQYSSLLAMLGGAFFHVTFGELVPKGLSLVVPLSVLHTVGPFMKMFRLLAVPFIKTCNAIANVVVKLMTGHDPDVAGHHDETVELREALMLAVSAGELKPQQLTLMRNVLATADRTVREAMTPAREVVTLDLQDDWAANMRVAEESGFSRFPVVNGNSHDLVGYVRRADILRSEIRGQRELNSLILPIERRPESALLGRVNLFQGTPMVAVYDEYDSFVGLLTAEDLVEQIVGEIYDDTDDVEAPVVRALEEGRYRMRGVTLLSSAAEQVPIPEFTQRTHEVDTVGGLLMQRLGRQPRAGDVVQLSGYSAMVEDAKGFRISSVLLTPVKDEPSTDN